MAATYLRAYRAGHTRAVHSLFRSAAPIFVLARPYSKSHDDKGLQIHSKRSPSGRNGGVGSGADSAGVPGHARKSVDLPHRVSYEYPAIPKRPHIPRQSSAWRRHIPFLMGVGGLIWAVYAYNYLFNAPESEQTILTPERFSKFRVTFKEEITPNLMLIEISPKYKAHLELLQTGGGLWNGKKLWSIQVKHPDIQIARKYTPLPMYYMQTLGEDNKPRGLLRLLSDNPDEGRMVLLVKKYDDGEMSRYLHSLPVGSDVEIRGPFIEHKFPYTQADMVPPRAAMSDVPSRVPPDVEFNESITKPDNVVFFTGGTGIAPAMQALLSPNPPRGFTEIYHSTRTGSEIPLKRFMLFLEKTGRAKFHQFVDDEGQLISSANVPPAVPRQPKSIQTKVTDQALKEPIPPVRNRYHSAVQQHMDKSHPFPYINGPALAVICGPGGYMKYIGGEPGENDQLPIGGLLGAKGWTLENTKRMSDW